MSEAADAWFAALKHGDVAAVERLLAAAPERVSARHASGLSSLTWACYARQETIVAVLVRAGAPLDVFEAVAAGESARALALLESDPALAFGYSGDGFTALHLAAFFARPALAEALLALGADPGAVARNAAAVQPLHSAAAAGDAATAALLLAHGAAPDARQRGGYTPLMAAAQRGDVALAEALLAHGASADLRADDGRAAADLADERSHHALAARLRA